MKVAFIASYPADDVKSWSGTVYHSYQECRRVFGDCVELDTRRVDFLLGKLRSLLLKAGIDLVREDATARLYGRLIGARLKAMKPDLIVSVASSQKIAALETEVPIVHVSDATFRAIAGYYPGYYARLKPRTIAAGERMESAVLGRAAASMLSSDWAARSALEDYATAPERVHVVPLGANLPADLQAPAERRLGSPVDLLFVSVDWERKGGPLAYEVIGLLREKGIPARLHVVGCTPPDAVAADPDVRCYGFLSKLVPEQFAAIDGLFRSASFLLVPSRQEAYGLVFAEASAYGLPVLATRTGGIPTIVEDGVNGYLFDLGAPAGAYAARIESLVAEPERYAALSHSARQRYEERLSWRAWGTKLREIAGRLAA